MMKLKKLWKELENENENILKIEIFLKIVENDDEKNYKINLNDIILNGLLILLD